MNESNLSKIKRRYFEVFGDLEMEISHLRKITLALIGTVFALLCFLVVVAKKPPVVIRVSEVKGAETIQDLRSNNAVTEYEILGFAKRFTARYTGYNSYTVSRDFTEALNQMTRTFQKEATKRILDTGLLSKVAEAGIDTLVEFKEARIEKETREYVAVWLVGVRRIRKYDVQAAAQETLFRSDLVLKNVPRSSSTPEGLLVEKYQEILLNDITERRSPR
jgi:hypothetical protein